MEFEESIISMIKCLIIASFSFAITYVESAYAHNEPESHQLCLVAKDYFGCIQSQLKEQKDNFRDSKVENTWRTFGPLLVNLSKLNIVDGNYLLPTLNKEGKPIYIGINCIKKKLNVAAAKGTWKGWNKPVEKFEEDLVKQICLIKNR